MKKEYAQFLLGKTQADYNLIASEFSSTREKPWEELRPLFDYYIKFKERVLDLGCGNGRGYDFLKGKEVNYLGVDNSEELIRLAKTRHPGVEFQFMDALNLQFPEASFNKIVSIAVLHHIPSAELRAKFFQEAKKVLRKDGLIILTVWNFHQPKEIFRLFKYCLLKLIGLSKMDFKDMLEPWGKKTNRYYHWFSQKELRKLAERAGFIVQKTGILKNKKGNRQNIYLIARRP